MSKNIYANKILPSVAQILRTGNLGRQHVEHSNYAHTGPTLTRRDKGRLQPNDRPSGGSCIQEQSTSDSGKLKNHRGDHARTKSNQVQKEPKNDKLSKKLEDLSRIGKDLKQLKKDQKKSKSHLNRLRALKVKRDYKMEWAEADRKERELKELLRKYPGLAKNKQLQMQISRMRENAHPCPNICDLSGSDIQEAFSEDPEMDCNMFAKLALENQSRDESDDFEASFSYEARGDKKNGKHRNISIPQDKRGGSSPKGGLLKCQTVKNLDKVKRGLMQCKGESGFFNPAQAFNCLNDIQKEENPNAYEPEVAKTINAIKAREDKLKKEQEDAKMKKINQAREQDRALFDFDEDINNLEEVKERYPAVAVPDFTPVEE